MALTFTIGIYRAKCAGQWHNQADKPVNVQGRDAGGAYRALFGKGWGWSRSGSDLLCPACLDEDRAGK